MGLNSKMCWEFIESGEILEAVKCSEREACVRVSWRTELLVEVKVRGRDRGVLRPPGSSLSLWMEQ